MFVMQNTFIKLYGTIHNKQVKSLYDKGIREFQKLISFLSFHDWCVLQRMPIFITLQSSFKMQNTKENCNSSLLHEFVTPIEAGNALQLIKEFKKWYTSTEVKESLWQQLVNAMSSNAINLDDGIERANQLTLYKHVCKLIDAAFLL